MSPGSDVRPRQSQAVSRRCVAKHAYEVSGDTLGDFPLNKVRFANCPEASGAAISTSVTLFTGAVISTQIVDVNRFSQPGGSNVDPHMPASIADVIPPNHLRGYESGTLRPRPLINFRILGDPFPTGSSVRPTSYISDLVIADLLYQQFGKTKTLASGLASDRPKLFRTFNCEGLCIVESGCGVVLARIRPIRFRARHRV